MQFGSFCCGVFVAVALLASVATCDKAKGIGVALFAAGVLLFWMAVPLFFALRIFRRKDL